MSKIKSAAIKIKHTSESFKAREGASVEEMLRTARLQVDKDGQNHCKYLLLIAPPACPAIAVL